MKTEFFKIMNILKDNNVDVTAIKGRYSKAGKRYTTCLKDIKQDGIDIAEIITRNNLDANYKIGNALKKVKALYKQDKLNDEGRENAEGLGIVEIPNLNAKAPLIKGGKVSNFHIDIVTSNIDKILNGELNNMQLRDLINKKAMEAQEIQIRDLGTIKRIVKIVLDDEPEKLEKYYDTLKSNNKYNYKQIRNHQKIHLAHIDVEKFEEAIIKNYLPQILKGDITFDIIEKELKTSHQTIDKIIKEYYLNTNNPEGLDEYNKAKKRNWGVSLDRRKNARIMREEIRNYQVVTNREFVLLPEEEQEKQVIMKMRQNRFEEEKRTGSQKVLSEDTTLKQFERIKEYFGNKNDLENGKEYFSKQDIRYIIFRSPTIADRTEDNLDEKLKVLTSYNEINEEMAYGMIKIFPAVMGYDVKRTKEQLDILQKENLIDAVIDKPMGLMRSPNLIYALIQFAKERHGTSDLSKINRNNIFMPNNTMKRLYGTTYEEIKERFPYSIETNEQDYPYTVSATDIGKATYKEGRKKSDEADNVIMSQLAKERTGKGEKNE